MITFETEIKVVVFLNGKRTGEIRQGPEGRGWRYHPKGRKKAAGDLFHSLAACQESLKG